MVSVIREIIRQHLSLNLDKSVESIHKNAKIRVIISNSPGRSVE
jgi:hypothetical protein